MGLHPHRRLPTIQCWPQQWRRSPARGSPGLGCASPVTLPPALSGQTLPLRTSERCGVPWKESLENCPSFHAWQVPNCVQTLSGRNACSLIPPKRWQISYRHIQSSQPCDVASGMNMLALLLRHDHLNVQVPTGEIPSRYLQ